MALLPAYAVDGGRVPASMARRVTYAVSSGANGIVSVNDLKVTQLPTAGTFVRISRGAALCRQRTSGANEFETYAIAQDSSSDLSIGTSSSYRTRYVIARVNDWHFTGGSAPADPLNAVYWEFVSVQTLDGITYPYVPLARLEIPANATAITDAMITDIRTVAIPRKERHLFTYDLSAGEDDVLVASESWPDIGGFPITVPSWATSANVSVTFAQVKVPAGSTATGFLTGKLRVNGIDRDFRTTKYDGSAPASVTRQTYVAAGDITIPSGMRGHTGILYSRGTRGGGTGSLVLDGNSSVVIDIEFVERAV